jgi:hypothetical protein
MLRATSVDTELDSDVLMDVVSLPEIVYELLWRP